MNPLIEQFKREMESFDNRKARCIGTDAEHSDAEMVKLLSNFIKSSYFTDKEFFIQTVLNLINKQIEGLEGKKKRFKCAACDGSKCGHTLGCIALSDTISELVEFREWLEKQIQ